MRLRSHPSSASGTLIRHAERGCNWRPRISPFYATNFLVDTARLQQPRSAAQRRTRRSRPPKTGSRFAHRPRSLVDVIVQFTTTPTQKHHDKIKSKGGVLKTDLSGAIKGAHYAVPAASWPSWPTIPRSPTSAPTGLFMGILMLPNPTVAANVARTAGFAGQGVGIAVLDSGIVETPDLLQAGQSSYKYTRVVYNQNFVPGTRSYVDQFGHGTHVAGILAGNGKYSTGAGYTRQLHRHGSGSHSDQLARPRPERSGKDSTVIAAIQPAIALKVQVQHPRSQPQLGRPVFGATRTDPLCQAVEKAWQGRNRGGGGSRQRGPQQ